MAARVRVLVPRIHLPLRRLALCLDCEECFEIGGACPACGTESWAPLARFLGDEAKAELRAAGRGGHRAPQHLLIVARDQPGLFRRLAQVLADNPTVKVVLDRRSRDHRNGLPYVGSERRWRKIEEQVSAMGWALVRVDHSRLAREPAR